MHRAHVGADMLTRLVRWAFNCLETVRLGIVGVTRIKVGKIEVQKLMKTDISSHDVVVLNNLL
jgi:hypothetical protein